MNLLEFRQNVEQLVEDFCQDYHRQRAKGRHQTMIRPESEWVELFNEFAETHSDAPVSL